MTTSPAPEVKPTKEVRFAVVMYGGVSLAIYINGVSQELLHLVKSTSDRSPNAEVTGSEKVYRELSRMLADDDSSNGDSTGETGAAPVRFIVDIVSGTSAGGINGVFLAKALANEQTIKSLEGLWIQQGEIQLLINDGKSLESPLELSDPPNSLLNSQRMYLELLKALDGMDDKNPAAERSALVDELDLFVTSTDIRGVTLPIRLADRVVCERRHRNVLHFVYSKSEVSGADEDRNDFKETNNPFLAYAARSTSAFPVAFEPMRLDDIDAILDELPKYRTNKKLRSNNEDWQKFYKDYLSDASPNPVPFPERSFNDGGVLDNKPFSYATETLSHRHADVPVDRKLIYIEPSPEHPELQLDNKVRPNAVESLRAGLSLPRNETIREDLQRILERNRLIHRANRIMRGIDADTECARASYIPAGDSPEAKFEEWKTLGALASHPPTDELWARDFLSEKDWEKLDLADMIKRKGKTYVAYHRLEIAETTDQLAALVARVSELDEDSDYFTIVRGLLKAWRDRRYTDYHEDAPEKPTMNAFLIGLGLSYPIRRINFLRNKIDKLYTLDEEAHQIINSRFKSYWPPNTELPADEKRKFRAALLGLKPPLNQIYIDLRSEGRLLRSRPTKKDALDKVEPANPVRDNIRAAIAGLAAAAAQEMTGRKSADPLVDYFLGNRLPDQSTSQRLSDSQVEEECTARAHDLLDKHPELRKLFDDAAAEIEKRVRDARAKAETASKNILFPSNTGGQDSGMEAARTCLSHYYERYDDYDMVTFPIFYETDVGESDVVEVARVSPEDACALIDETKSGCHKLAGTALGHFGAFLNEDWRKNDILWGRLDGAERIISALLPNDNRAREMIGRAQSAILWETIEKMGPDATKNLLVEALMRPRNGKADQEAVDTLLAYLSNLKTYCEPALAETLNERIKDGEITDYYRAEFKERAKLEPESTLRTAARATTVIGKILSGISTSYEISDRYTAWIVRLGQIFWGLVEVAVPRSLPNLIFRHWLKVIYAFEVLAILGGMIFAKQQVSQFGWIAFGVTAAVNAVAWWLGDFMSGRTSVARFLVVVIAAVLIMLTVIGGLKVASLWFGFTVHDRPVLAWLHENANNVFAWLGKYLPEKVVGILKDSVPLLAAIGLVFVLWWRARFGMRGRGPAKVSAPRTPDAC